MLTKKQSKWLGGVLLILGLFLILPIPDVLDIFGLKIFSIYKGVELSAENISLYYFDYLLITFLLGVVSLFAGLNLLGKDWKYLKKKFDIGHYKKAMFLAVLTVLAVSLLDIYSAYSGILGSVSEYTNGNFGVDGWWNLFFRFVLIIFAIVPLCYYFLIHKDKSETLGLFGFSTILYFGGLADVGYFLFQRIPIPYELPWLMGSPFIGFVSRTLGYSTVTANSLIISLVFSFIIAWVFAKIMKEKF